MVPSTYKRFDYGYAVTAHRSLGARYQQRAISSIAAMYTVFSVGPGRSEF
jgi:hypothetical protein